MHTATQGMLHSKALSNQQRSVNLERFSRVMNPRINDGGLSLSLNCPADSIQQDSERDHRHHDRCPLEAGPILLQNKPISCSNPCIAKVQAGAPRFQGVPKPLQHSTSVPQKQAGDACGRLSFLPALKRRGFQKGTSVKKIWWSFLFLSLIVLLAACGSEVTPRSSSSGSIVSDSLGHSGVQQLPTPTPTPISPLSIPSQKATPVPTVKPHISPTPTSTPIPIPIRTDT